MLVWTINHHPAGHREAGILISIKGIKGQYDPSHPHLNWIVDSKAIGVQCQQPCQYHHNWIGQKAPGIPNVVDGVGRLEAT